MTVSFHSTLNQPHSIIDESKENFTHLKVQIDKTEKVWDERIRLKKDPNIRAFTFERSHILCSQLCSELKNPSMNDWEQIKKLQKCYSRLRELPASSLEYNRVETLLEHKHKDQLLNLINNLQMGQQLNMNLLYFLISINPQKMLSHLLSLLGPRFEFSLLDITLTEIEHNPEMRFLDVWQQALNGLKAKNSNYMFIPKEDMDALEYKAFELQQRIIMLEQANFDPIEF